MLKVITKISECCHKQQELLQSEELSPKLAGNLNDLMHFVGYKAKGRISKRVLQENKARQIFRKRTFLTP